MLLLPVVRCSGVRGCPRGEGLRGLPGSGGGGGGHYHQGGWRGGGRVHSSHQQPMGSTLDSIWSFGKAAILISDEASTC